MEDQKDQNEGPEERNWFESVPIWAKVILALFIMLLVSAFVRAVGVALFS